VALLTVCIPGWARIRVKCIESQINATTDILIKNVAGFPYDYSGFQLYFDDQVYDLSALADMDLATDEEVTINVPGHPSGYFSSAIFYPGVDPTGSPTPADIIDFFQAEGSNQAHEAIAQAAGLWTAGDFVLQEYILPAYWHTGGNSDEGAGFWVGYLCGQYVGLADMTAREDEAPWPNPFTESLRMQITADFIGQLVLMDMSGRVLEEKHLSGKMTETTMGEGLRQGCYVLRRRDQFGNELLWKVLKE
jgi:hypothetical protein